VADDAIADASRGPSGEAIIGSGPPQVRIVGVGIASLGPVRWTSDRPAGALCRPARRRQTHLAIAREIRVWFPFKPARSGFELTAY
jgi:hypothetical protein